MRKVFKTLYKIYKNHHLNLFNYIFNSPIAAKRFYICLQVILFLIKKAQPILVFYALIISERFRKSMAYDAARENDEEILCDDVNV